jgi:hypothetical protein
VPFAGTPWEAAGVAAAEEGIAASTSEAAEVTVALLVMVEVMTLGAVKTVVLPAEVIVCPTGQVVIVSETTSVT